MVNVVLATHLAELVDLDGRRVKSVEVKAGPWPEFVSDMRGRYPRLAARVFSDRGGLAPGFALVLNDEIVHGRLGDLCLASRDEVCILVTIAGG